MIDKKAVSLLNEMTKEEIIGWLSDQLPFILHPPRRSDILFYRWQRKSLEVQNKWEAHIAKWKPLSMAKRDEYAVQFNASKDMNEKLNLLEKMKPYEDQLRQMLNESKALDKEQKAVDRMYEQIDVVREQEERGDV
jgi:hypothetical protein